jgi:hypothetical protein
MKTYKWFFLILVASLFVACGSDSEEELVGDWQRRAPSPKMRAYMATFVIGDKGYACCGTNGTGEMRARREVYAFDHTAGVNGSWIETLGAFPGSARQQAVGFSLNGKGYVGTGWDGDLTDMKDFWQYDPASDTWTEVAPLPGAARRGAIAFSLTVNGQEYGYVGTGYTEKPEKDYMFDFWQFDPAQTTDVDGVTLQGKWTSVGGYGGGKRSGASVFVLNNKAYICLGENSGGNITDFWMFDPDGHAKDNSKLWEWKRQMNDTNKEEDYDDDYRPLARSFGVAFTETAEGGQVRGFVALGRNKSDVWEYDPDNDLWEQKTTFYNNSTSQARAGAVAFSFPSTNRAFAGMGSNGTFYYDDFWEFFPTEEDYLHNDYQ